MEGSGRRLGWIAIGLGLLALAVALGGRAQSRAWQAVGPQGGFGPPALAMPHGQIGPPAWITPRQDAGPRGGWDFRPPWQDRQGFRGPFGMLPGALLFLPSFLIGGLVRMLLFLLLIALAVRFLGRRGGPARPGGTPPPDQPGPERPPYTGETQNL